ncbi:transposase family protein [Thioflavicoccus mobilis 8321]|uniref:Transposase family protein n=1 Tax=Thioflavicoccus mobilis 8321 TaxID=765912 RepID=L0GXV9_9GAMM|nr:ISL3 family transposase [Thioflavicoccus mobilis]AGA90215.1 transposase family protein [Thioflavicoccus mobilis 8321]
MNPTTSLFTAALGLSVPWEVLDVGFDPVAGRIDFTVGCAAGTRFTCAQCGAKHQPVHDTRERQWRHLNFFQYHAYLHAKVPRVQCAACGKTTQVEVPWARAQSGFTPLMEALIVTLCRAMTVRQVARLLGVSDMRIWRILDHYVERGREREDFSQVRDVGLDETAARRGQHYISLFHDLQAQRLLYACEGRKGEVVAQFAEDLEAHDGCAENIINVGIDMSASYRAGLAEHLLWAAVTFDEFHVIQLLNKAVDAVRHQDVKANPLLKHSRDLWLKDQRQWSPKPLRQYLDLRPLNLKTHRAFRIKESLREIYRIARSRAEAELLLGQWYSWARRARLEPIKQVAKTLKDHWAGLLNAFDSKLTNARVEAANARIQAAKAHGYGTVGHLITIAYLVAGKLTHLPASPFELRRLQNALNPTG